MKGLAKRMSGCVSKAASQARVCGVVLRGLAGGGGDGVGAEEHGVFGFNLVTYECK